MLSDAMRLGLIILAAGLLSACAERQQAFDSQYRDVSGRTRSEAALHTDEAACRYQINSTANNGVDNASLLTDCMRARSWQTVGRQTHYVKQGFGL